MSFTIIELTGHNGQAGAEWDQNVTNEKEDKK